MMQRICVIGLDGADWRLLRPWLAVGELPNLARLCDEGATGNLGSTIRPESSVAWSSFATGVNPGKHGVFGFMVQQSPDSHRYQIANGATIRSERFWQTLSAAGRRVALLNVPFTYPPQPLNGAVVTGMMTPGSHVAFTHPPELQDEFLAQFPDYVFDPESGDKSAEIVFQNVTTATDQQLAAAMWLLEREAWDCFAVVFTGPDRLQHFAWQRPDLLLAHYRQLDAAIGVIVSKMPDDTLTLIMSDHGFNGVAGRFYGNQWLAENGWLTFKAGKSADHQLLNLVKKAQSVGWLRKLKRKLLPSDFGATKLSASQFGAQIDWSRTRAYFAPDGGVHLVDGGREAHDSATDYTKERAELQTALTQIMVDGVPLFANVYTRDELYTGNALALAPDLVAEPQREMAEVHFVLDSSAEPHPSPFGDATPYQATHAPDGILIAHGKTIQPQTLDANIIDLAPTILAAQGVSIPDSMDGEALVGLFAAEHRPDIRHHSATNQPTIATTSDDADVAERLRQLGYIE